MMLELNARPEAAGAEAPARRKTHVLEEFPHPRLECVVVEWRGAAPTVLVQVLRDPAEPVQFPGLRPAVPGNDRLSRDLPSALDRPLVDFVDAATGRVFGRPAYTADIVFSQRAFSLLQPEPDLVLPAQDLWECRAEALAALKIEG
jgi:hypothetical protein